METRAIQKTSQYVNLQKLVRKFSPPISPQSEFKKVETISKNHFEQERFHLGVIHQYLSVSHYVGRHVRNLGFSQEARNEFEKGLDKNKARMKFKALNQKYLRALVFVENNRSWSSYLRTPDSERIRISKQRSLEEAEFPNGNNVKQFLGDSMNDVLDEFETFEYEKELKQRLACL